jgi:sec-independent protein translocase protein TatB
MIRESELEEMEKKWREENERIMREHPLLSHDGVMMPVAPPPPGGEQPVEPGWDQAAAEAPVVSDTSAVAQPPTISEAPSSAEAPATDPTAPELPLGPPVAAPGRELP